MTPGLGSGIFDIVGCIHFILFLDIRIFNRNEFE